MGPSKEWRQTVKQKNTYVHAKRRHEKRRQSSQTRPHVVMHYYVNNNSVTSGRPHIHESVQRMATKTVDTTTHIYMKTVEVTSRSGEDDNQSKEG